MDAPQGGVNKLPGGREPFHALQLRKFYHKFTNKGICFHSLKSGGLKQSEIAWWKRRSGRKKL